MTYQCHANPSHITSKPLKAIMNGRNLLVCPHCLDEAVHPSTSEPQEQQQQQPPYKGDQNE